MINILPIVLLSSIAFYNTNAETSFVHPGIWFKQDDLNRMRTMIEANAEPWKMTSVSLKNNANRWRGSNAVVNQTGEMDLQYSGSNILLLALAWVVTGDISYGNAARNYLNEWSIYERGGTCLRQGVGSGSLVNAAEIIRHASVNGVKVSWPSIEIVKFENMLTNYMMVTLETLRNGGDGGWGTPAINAMASIGVFCNNVAIYNKAIQLFKYGSKSVYSDATACNGVLEMIDDKGQSYDSGRDQPHAQFLISHLFDVAIIAWNQGTDDLFSYGNNRLLLGMEYGAKYNLNETVPYTQQYECNGRKKWGSAISTVNRYQFYPMYEKCVAYYEMVKGIPAPYSKQVINKSGYYPERNMHDCLGYGGLLYRRQPFD